MLTRCTHCATEYVLEESALPATGMSLRCGHCHKVFGVIPVQGTPSPVNTWQVRLVSGAVYEPGDLATLQRWIIERRVTRDDLLTQDGATWQRLGNIAEFGPFFAAVPNPDAVIPTVQPAAAPVQAPPPSSAPPRARTGERAMPKWAGLPEEDSINALPGSLDIQRRTTGRRRTDSRTTLDRIFEEKPAASAFSFPMDLPEDDDVAAHQRRGRTSRGMFVVLLLLGAAAGCLYVYQPTAVAGLVSMVRRAPVADAAVQQVKSGYEALDKDSMTSIQTAMAAFDRATRVDDRYADARAGQAEAELRLAESYQQAADDLAHYADTLPKKDRVRRLAQVTDQKQEAAVRSERALSAAKEALALAPEAAAANRALADYYRVQGADNRKVKPLLDRARAAAPEDPRQLYVAAASLETATPAQAIEVYQQVLAAAPQLNHARYRLARLLLAQGDKAAAVQQVEAILKSAPDHELAQALLTQLQPSAGGPSASLADLPTPNAAALAAAAPPPAPAPAEPTHAPAAKPARPAAPAAPAQPMAPVQDVTPPTPLPGAPVANVTPPTPAVAAVEAPSEPHVNVAAGLGKVPAADGSDASTGATYEALLTQGQVLRGRHQIAQAAAVLQRAIAKDSNAPRAYVALGWCDLDQHDADSALSHFTSALQKSPRNAEAHFGVAEAYRAKNERREAMKHYREYLSITPDGLMAKVARQMLEELSK